MTHETTIGDRLYYCEPHPFDEALALELDLAEILGGPAAGVLAAVFDGFASVESGAVKELGDGLVTLAKQITSKGGPALVRRVLKHTRVRTVIQASEGGVERLVSCAEKTAMDELYRGNLGEMWIAVAWVVGVNFNPFGPETFAGLMPSLKELGSKMMQELSATLRQPAPGIDRPPASEPAPS